MAVLKGPGAMTGVNLVARQYFTSEHTNEKTGKTSKFADVMIDHRDSRGKDQTNLHVSTRKIEGKDGKPRYSNDAAYAAEGQWDKIVAAAGDNVQPILNKEGEQVGNAYGVKASLMKASRGGLIINTNKPLEASDFKMKPKTVDKQFESMKAAKETKAVQAPQADAPEATQVQAAEVSAAEVSNDEPSFG